MKTNPGVHVQRAALLTGLSWNTCLYHLRVLEQRKQVVPVKVQGKLCWFDRSKGAFQGKRAAALLQDRQNQRIVREILAHPGEHQLNVARSLGLAASTVCRRLVRLEEAGLVIRAPAAKSIPLFPSDTLEPMARQAGVVVETTDAAHQRPARPARVDATPIAETVAQPA